ncbi:MAG: HPr(Ser) kinase/phosphatase [Syntrophorhabdaceae bacterium]|nr:HPr(Ser) kinase/phosphatase [Syntrophorhabdaceae bacterium]
MAVSVMVFQKECSSSLQIRLLAGEKGLGREITAAGPSEVGLAITGEAFPLDAGRVAILGKNEIDYFLCQTPRRQAEIADKIFSYPSPCIITTSDLDVPDVFLDAANRRGMPFFVSSILIADLVEELQWELRRLLRESATVHGVLVDILGIGVLLAGQSGVGKSECALDLIVRGSRLVADDIILVEKAGSATLIGRGNKLTQHHMEVRGLGILNIRDLFGLIATRHAKKIELVIRIELWEKGKEYDRLGVEQECVEILGVRLPSLLIPVSPGRNVATIVEVAVRNHLLKQQGVNSAAELIERQIQKAGGIVES